MIHQIAFAGFRHPHILALWKRAQSSPACKIVAVWEDDSATRGQLMKEENIAPTHTDYADMLKTSGCDIVAIGDVYARRGALVIAALKAGKHVICDKPICTSLEELDEIASLAKAGHLSVGCQLDLVESPVLRKLRHIIRQDMIGRVCTIHITAQHPLRFGSRADWYFSPGQHGGTINDIGVHVFDLGPWLTDSPWRDLLSARSWNAKAIAAPHFQDCAQILATLESGASCFADLSYLAPDGLGYTLPQYWRVTVHGTKGMAETNYTGSTVTVVTDQDTEPQQIPAPSDQVPGYLQDFLDEINGTPSAQGLTTARVLRASRKALEAQASATS